MVALVKNLSNKITRLLSFTASHLNSSLDVLKFTQASPVAVAGFKHSQTPVFL